MRISFNTILFVWLSVSAFGRSDEFIIMDKHNKELGSLTVHKTIKNGIKKIKVQSRVEVKKFITVVLSYTLESEFQKDRLISNKIIMYQNDKVRDVMSTQKTGDSYMYVKNKESRQVKDFTFCESMLYYNEPINQSKIYSEFDGVFKSVRADKIEHSYALTNPANNNVSIYWFKNGVLSKAVVKHTLLDLYLYRID